MLGGRGFRFVNRDHSISRDVLQVLHDAAGPANFDRVGLLGLAQAEVDALVAGGKIASAGRSRFVLNQLAGRQLYLGADAVAVGFVPDQVQRQPVIAAGGFVMQQMGLAAVGGDDGIQPAQAWVKTAPAVFETSIKLSPVPCSRSMGSL
jgi:hypothetical protein